jgi:hypothetical protein
MEFFIFVLYFKLSYVIPNFYTILQRRKRQHRSAGACTTSFRAILLLLTHEKQAWVKDKDILEL